MHENMKLNHMRVWKSMDQSLLWVIGFIPKSPPLCVQTGIS